jgi:acylphosphatase
MPRKHCYFSGHVQGVGFRYTAQSLAQRRPVTGFVRNLPDGRVELVAEGEEPHLTDLLNDIQQTMEGRIKNLAINDSPSTNEFQGFSIRH